MFLTTTNLLHYLMGRGLVSASAIVDGELCVVEAGRRNRNFKVLRTRKPGLFVKQISGAAPDAVATLHREAAFYTCVRDRPAFQPLAGLVPRLLHFEPSTCALVVESHDGAENLTEYHLRVGGYPAEVGALIGDGLGRYHAHTARLLLEPAELLAFPRQVPWILTTDPRTPSAAAALGHGGVALAALLQDYPHIVDHVRAVAQEWQFDCVIHGDMKWDNLLIFADGHGRQALQVVDWELADLGDAAWDVASIFTAYLSFWIWASLTAAQQHEHEQQQEQQPQPRPPGAAAPPMPPAPRPDVNLAGTLEDTRPALLAFWRAYVAARAIEPSAAEAWLARGVRFCAARLLLAVFECLYNAPQITAMTRAMLHVSHALFMHPERSLSDMLGTPADRMRS
jgi:Ser/Thr protein kinase RdoA (MazF antagonist)